MPYSSLCNQGQSFTIPFSPPEPASSLIGTSEPCLAEWHQRNKIANNSKTPQIHNFLFFSWEKLCDPGTTRCTTTQRVHVIGDRDYYEVRIPRKQRRESGRATRPPAANPDDQMGVSRIKWLADALLRCCMMKGSSATRVSNPAK